jgi:uracil-DNA glycosylase
MTIPPHFLAACATRVRGGAAIGTLAELQGRLIGHGFLLLNAARVFRSHVAPVKDARAWRPFFTTVMDTLAGRAPPPQTGVVGQNRRTIEQAAGRASHAASSGRASCAPTCIANRDMHALSGPLHLLQGGQDAGKYRSLG